jgi:hypothetical protein
MKFTDKEIQLARDMQNAGLEWKPEVGDYFTTGKYIDGGYNVEIVFRVPERFPYFVNSISWLPLWHQCRELLTENDIVIAFYSKILYAGGKQPGSQIDCYKWIDSTIPRFLGTVCGDTDLEAMYQIILLFVLDAQLAAGDLERGN